MPEKPSRVSLDTSAIHAAYERQEIEPHVRFGSGERYTFGTTRVDIYPQPPELAPVVQMRLRNGGLLLGDVLHILPTEEGGLHIDHQDGMCEVGKTGNIAYVYTAPPAVRLSSDGKVHQDRYGRNYTQTSMEVTGTTEGVRVQIYGMIEAAPRPVSGKRGSPLQFNMLEYSPAKPDEPLVHEVWATNKAREELATLKLKKDDSIDAILYRHTWPVMLQGGETETHTRHYLAKVITVERKGHAKRRTQEQESDSSLS